jgi:hypothetical protein
VNLFRRHRDQPSKEIEPTLELPPLPKKTPPLVLNKPISLSSAQQAILANPVNPRVARVLSRRSASPDEPFGHPLI